MRHKRAVLHRIMLDRHVRIAGAGEYERPAFESPLHPTGEDFIVTDP
jgi:hypothetical protein